MALKVDDVSSQLAFKFTSASFDPEKCKAEKKTSNVIISFNLGNLSVEQLSSL